MDLLEAIILGIVQGLTEFLPVSSSGHIEIVEYLMGDELNRGNGMLMTVILHFATALSTVVYFRNDILKLIKGMFTKEHSSYILYILISMVPAVIIGLFFEDFLEALFDRQIRLVGAMLIVTGLLLLYAGRKHLTSGKVDGSKAIVIGLAQAVALLPGISRSGATISTSLLLNVERAEAARFSFLMVIPLIFGKIAKDLIGGDIVLEQSTSYYFIGFIFAFIVGLLACKFMVGIVKKAKLKYFSYYCFIIGGGIIALSLMNA